MRLEGRKSGLPDLRFEMPISGKPEIGRGPMLRDAQLCCAPQHEAGRGLIAWLAFAAAIALVALLSATTARAEPVRCSNEAKTCTDACGPLRDRQSLSACITTCQARMASCRLTGCWDDGSFRYCGLLRQ